MFTKKAFFMLFSVLIMATIIQAAEVVFVTRTPALTDPATGEGPDQPHIDALIDAGYDVILFYNPSISTASEATLDTLRNADLIVIGRSVPSTTTQDPEKQPWNELTTPILNLEMWTLRNSRLNWFNTADIFTGSDSAIYNAIIMAPEDPVFEGLELDLENPVPWINNVYDVIGTTDAGNGKVLAINETDSAVLFVRFEPELEFYDETTDFPLGWRTVLGNGRDEGSNPPFHYYNFTPQSEAVFLAECENLIILGGGPASIRNKGIMDRPETFELSQNFPNPFNPTTTIPFYLPEHSQVRITVSNILGEEVSEVTNHEFAAGYHEVRFNGENLAAGVYFYKLEAGNYSDVKKLIIVK